ncbi:MAG: AmmeMemoRadiSam system protein A [Phycisphaerae bacterium]
MEPIDERTGARLLALARARITEAVTGERHTPSPDEPWPAMEPRGVFVTLRKSGRLRGCIGTFEPSSGLPDTVATMAEAATRDPRFLNNPIRADELADIRIELSILSPRVRIRDPLAFELGRHGLYLKHGHAAGCFLPDVGADLGWDKETFLSELCRQKAGLSPQDWRDDAAEIYTFTVQKFAE